MAVTPYIPQSVVAQQADGNILITWTAATGATSYVVQRSTDGVNFTTLATTGIVSSYLDSMPGVGIQYWYQVAASNTAGTSSYSNIATMVAAIPGEMSLLELRTRAQQTADRVGSNFVTTEEANAMIRVSMYELYDMLITQYSDFNIAAPAYITTNGSTFQYAMPDGTNYLGGVYGGTSGLPASRFYKLSGIDLGVNTSNNAWVTLRSFDWVDRNNYVYPNSTSTIYGVYNMRYRLMGNNLTLIPVPAGNQQLRLWYAPVLPALLRDTDLTTIGWSGWLRYAIVRTAKYMLDKEEGTDTSKLDQEIVFLKQRIEDSAAVRDQGMAETISNTRRDPVYGGAGWGNGANGGF